MREVEAELTAFATRQIAVIEDTAGPGQSAIDEPDRRIARSQAGSARRASTGA